MKIAVREETNLHYDLPFKIGNLLAIPADAAGKIVSSKNPDAALLFLHLLLTGGVLEQESACVGTGLTAPRLKCALETLIVAGALGNSVQDAPHPVKTAEPAGKTAQDKPQATRPTLTVECADYTQEEIARGLSGDSSFAWLYREAESRIGRVLKQYEASALYSMYDYLKLPPEVIAMLINHMVGENELRIRDGRDIRPLSFRELSREACRWSDLGINTPERADAYIQKQIARKSVYGTVLRILNIRDRACTATEDKYISAWLDMGIGTELIARAYDITVTNMGKLVWPYMRTILDRWHQKGYRTAADVEQNERQSQNLARAASGDGNAFDGQESAYIERVKRAMRDSGDNA